MTYWLVSVMLSLILLWQDTKVFKFKEVAAVIIFAPLVSVAAIILWSQQLLKFIKYYRGNYG